jgi:polyhydroxyalkanoate synthase
MASSLKGNGSRLAPNDDALQHGPRPLTLFLQLVREQTAGDPERLGRVLAGLRAYQEAHRSPALEPTRAIAARRGAALRDYGGDGSPLLFIPSLINPPHVLDLTPDNSLLRWLASQGHHVLLVDWGNDMEARRGLSVAGHIEEILLPFIAGIGEPPALAGYCLGGTMAIGAAAAARASSLVLIAAPWRFGGFPHDAKELLASLWKAAEPGVSRLGLLPMEVLQAAFWSLDPARTVAKFERFEGDPSPAFVALEDWANDGPALPEAAARELFERFFRVDDPGRGEWRVAGEKVDPARLSCPILNIVSTTDRIVPHQSAAPTGERLDLDLGHVGMVVGSRAREALWEPLAGWLSRLRST